MKILCTGATGFLGSHLVEALQIAGHEVRAMAHYRSSPDPGNLEADCEVFRGDITDRDSVDAAVKGMELVCHLAALVDVPYSFQVPEAYLRTNTLGTLNVLEACKKRKAKLIFANSSESYGTTPKGECICENKPQAAHSPYAASKIGAMQLCRSYAMAYAMPILSLTMFNVYGPRQSDRAVIPTVIKQLLKGHRVDIGDPTPVRDFTYVMDTCEAWVKAAARLEKKWLEFDNINVGSNNPISIRQLIDVIAKEIHIIPAIMVHPEKFREGYEVKRLDASWLRAKNMLAWHPTLKLEEGIAKTVEWFRAKQS